MSEQQSDDLGWPYGLALPGWPDLADQTLAAVGPPTGTVSPYEDVPTWNLASSAQLVKLKCKGDDRRGRPCGETAGFVVDTGHGRVATVRAPVPGRVDAVRSEVEAGADWNATPAETENLDRARFGEMTGELDNAFADAGETENLVALRVRADALIAEIDGMLPSRPEVAVVHRGVKGDVDVWEFFLYPIDAGTRPVPVWCRSCEHRAVVTVGKLRAAASKGARRGKPTILDV